LTRASKCLGIKFHTTRSGVDERPYQYQAYSLGLIDELLLEAIEKLDEERAKYDGKTEWELDRILEDKANKSRQQFFRKYGRPPEGFEGEYELFNEVINFDKVDPLAVLTADEQARIDRLVTLRREVEVRKGLLESVLTRYATATSVLSISDDSDMENVDGGGIFGVEGDRSGADLATG
jgi:hypothetical protein